MRHPQLAGRAVGLEYVFAGEVDDARSDVAAALGSMGHVALGDDQV